MTVRQKHNLLGYVFEEKKNKAVNIISLNLNIVITVAVDCYVWSSMSNSSNSLTHSLCLNIKYFT